MYKLRVNKKIKMVKTYILEKKKEMYNKDKLIR